MLSRLAVAVLVLLACAACGGAGDAVAPSPIFESTTLATPGPAVVGDPVILAPPTARPNCGKFNPCPTPMPPVCAPGASC
jgi:hypothetical protein